jgi:hypothetical protein
MKFLWWDQLPLIVKLALSGMVKLNPRGTNNEDLRVNSSKRLQVGLGMQSRRLRKSLLCLAFWLLADLKGLLAPRHALEAC